MSELDTVLANVVSRLETAKKSRDWSGKVTKKEKFHTPPGLFKKSGKTIADYLLKTADSPKQARLRLTFYMNRAGKGLPDEEMSELNKAKAIIKKAEEKVGE